MLLQLSYVAWFNLYSFATNVTNHVAASHMYNIISTKTDYISICEIREFTCSNLQARALTNYV